MNPIFIYSIEDATKKKAGFFLAIDSAAEYDSGFSKLRAIAIMATKKTADGTIIRVEELRKLSSAQKKFLGIAQNKTEVEFIIQ